MSVSVCMCERESVSVCERREMCGLAISLGIVPWALGERTCMCVCERESVRE